MTNLYHLLGKNSLVALLSRFSLVGVLATLIYLIVALALLKFSSMKDAHASVLAYGVGMMISFLGQSRFTFRVRHNTWMQVLRFCVLSAVGLTVSYVLVDMAAPVFGVSSYWGAIGTALLIPVISFVVMKFWVFNENDPR